MKKMLNNPKIKQLIKMNLFLVLKGVVENSIKEHLKNIQKHVNWFLCLKENNLIQRLRELPQKNRYYIHSFLG